MDLVPRFDRARNPHVGFVTLRPWLSDMSQLGRLPVDSLRALAVARVGVSDRRAQEEREGDTLGRKTPAIGHSCVPIQSGKGKRHNAKINRFRQFDKAISSAV